MVPVVTLCTPPMCQGFAQISSHVDAHPERRHRDCAKLTCGFGFVELSEIQQEPIYEDRGLGRAIGKLWATPWMIHSRAYQIDGKTCKGFSGLPNRNASVNDVR